MCFRQSPHYFLQNIVVFFLKKTMFVKVTSLQCATFLVSHFLKASKKIISVLSLQVEMVFLFFAFNVKAKNKDKSF